tara:strand:- start:7410 stop:7628 length:219 start_codon:yes stop_codon:yes gene_type:complete
MPNEELRNLRKILEHQLSQKRKELNSAFEDYSQKSRTPGVVLSNSASRDHWIKIKGEYEGLSSALESLYSIL